MADEALANWANYGLPCRRQEGGRPSLQGSGQEVRWQGRRRHPGRACDEGQQGRLGPRAHARQRTSERGRRQEAGGLDSVAEVIRSAAGAPRGHWRQKAAARHALRLLFLVCRRLGRRPGSAVLSQLIQGSW